MNRYVVPETGQYLVWASDPGRRETRVLIDGVPAADRAAESTLGPFGDATLNLRLDLVEGSEITTSPPNAAMTVRRASGEN
jgi:hypothetical protein